MNTETVTRAFEHQIAHLFQLKPRTPRDFQVITPFFFEDGDGMVLHLAETEHGWVLTDNGHTMMRLSYDMDIRDLQRGTREWLLKRTLAEFGVELERGRLTRRVDERTIGQATADMCQCILKLADLTFLKQDRVESTFKEDVVKIIRRKIGEQRVTEDWHDEAHDPKALYRADVKINHRPKPLFVFTLYNEATTLKAALSIEAYRNWDLQFDALGVFENPEEIPGPTRERFGNVCPSQFVNPPRNKERFEEVIVRLAG